MSDGLSLLGKCTLLYGFAAHLALDSHIRDLECIIKPFCKTLLLTLGQVDEQDRTSRAGQEKPTKTGQDEQDRVERAGQAG
jgi:hypothetical protein